VIKKPPSTDKLQRRWVFSSRSIMMPSARNTSAGLRFWKIDELEAYERSAARQIAGAR